MSHPAFQSNKTLKQYVNQKLNIFLEQKVGIIPKNQRFQFKEKLNQNKPLPESFINESSSNLNLSSNSLNINIIANKKNNIINESNSKSNNNSFIALNYQYNNKRLISNLKKSENKNLINMNRQNEDKKKDLYKNYLTNTPINTKNNNNKTTPINIHKRKSIYNSNKSLVKEKKKRKISFTKNRSCQKPLNFNRNFNGINDTSKTLYFMRKSNQTKTLKQEINDIIYKKEINNNIHEINNSYLMDFIESKASKKINNIKLSKKYDNDLIHNINYNEHDYNNKSNKSILLNNTINQFLKNDESYSENKCPVPMPYVKKYSIDNNNNNENINWDNILMNKLLKEPEEEKIIPLPISQFINESYSVNNKLKKKIF